MRMVILGAKGGIGKSTIGLLIAKILLSLGMKILIIDRDMTGYISWLAGIKGKGLLASVIDNEESQYFTKINVRKGTLYVLKFYGDGPRLTKDVHLFSRQDIAKRVKEKYEEVLSTPHDHVIYDNMSMIEPNEVEISLEIGLYLSKYPEAKSYWIYVSDSLQVNLITLSEYDDYLWGKWAKNLRVLGRSLIINMVPDNYVIPKEFEKESARFDTVLTVPFYESLFQFEGNIEELPELENLKPIVKAIERKEVGK
ncbi:MAG: AAA family ATPase [Metallosphaera sp.]